MLITSLELRRAMAERRLSSDDLGAALGIASAQIRKWRSGARPIPPHHAERLAVIFASPPPARPAAPRPLPAIVAAIRDRTDGQAPRPRLTRKERAHIRALAKAADPEMARPRKERPSRRKRIYPVPEHTVTWEGVAAALAARSAGASPAPAMPWRVDMIPGAISPAPVVSGGPRCAFREVRSGTVQTCAVLVPPGGRFCAAHS